jgi:hypothetical protein
LSPCEQVTRGEIPQPKEPKVEKVVDGASALLEKIDHLHPLNAIVKAGAANLQSNADVVEVNRQIAGRNYSAPFNEAIREKDYLEFLRFCGKQKLPLGIDTEIYQAAKQFYTGTLENPKIANLKQQLAKKIAKGKRIEEEWPESRDRDESMRRNQRFINELLAEIKRLENEQS